MNVSDAGSNWSEIQPHLDQVLELEPAQREAWLTDLETKQPQMAWALRAVLAQCEALNRGGFLNTPLLARTGVTAAQLRGLLDQHDAGTSGGATRDAWQELSEGQTVGPYRLIRNIGHGGMSSVWLAAHCDGQLKREVALKLPFIDSNLRLELFERERDVLAALTHPQIARLYDAGISTSGQPYLAMEYVEGTALPSSCEARQLGVRARLQLFLQVLEAVQFAHSALIIHRDLKPSNILVTPQGRVVLLDFGISKLLTEPSTHATRLGRALTPDYASPEQIAGRPLGTASDIYTLGVILYELLTGLRPYRLRRASTAALEEAILDGELRAPSAQVLTGTQKVPLARRALARSLSGDLDTIVLKALKKTPAERYASVSAFAQDIDNYLQGLPVSARPDSFWYRASRFVARHKAPVAAACVSVLVLIVGAWLFHAEAVKAETAFTRAAAMASRNAAVTEFLGRLMREAPQSPHPLTLSEILARGERLALQDSGDPPENRAAVLEMLAEHYWNLSDIEHAGKLMTRAIGLLAASPDRGLRARAICKLAVFQADVSTASQAIRNIMREVDAPGVDPETEAECLLDRAIIDGHMERAEDMLRATRRGLDRVAAANSSSSLLGTRLLGNYAYATYLQGRSFEAQQYFERTLRQYQSLGRERSQDAFNMLSNWALMLLQLEPRRALELVERAASIERTRELNAALDPVLATNRASALQLIGRFSEAQSASVAQCGALGQEDVPCLHVLAGILLELQQTERAAEYLARTTRIIGTARTADPEHVTQALLEGRMALLRGELSTAEQNFQWILRNAKPTSEVWRHHAALELARANPNAAAADARRALQLSQAQQQGFAHSRETGLAWLTLGHAQRALGQRETARQSFAAAVAHLASTVDADHPRLIEARRLATQ